GGFGAGNKRSPKFYDFQGQVPLLAEGRIYERVEYIEGLPVADCLPVVVVGGLERAARIHLELPAALDEQVLGHGVVIHAAISANETECRYGDNAHLDRGLVPQPRAIGERDERFEQIRGDLAFGDLMKLTWVAREVESLAAVWRPEDLVLGQTDDDPLQANFLILDEVVYNRHLLVFGPEVELLHPHRQAVDQPTRRPDDLCEFLCPPDHIARLIALIGPHD